MTHERAVYILAKLNERLDNGNSWIYGTPDGYTDQSWRNAITESITVIVQDYLEKLEAEKT